MNLLISDVNLTRRALGGLVLASACARAGAAEEAPGLDAAGQVQAVLPAAAPDAGGFAWTRLAAGLQFRHEGIIKSIVFYGPGTVRVSAHRGTVHTRQPSLVVVARPQPLALDVIDTSDRLEIRSAALHVRVDKRSGALAFHRADGSLLTREREDAPAEIRPVRIDGEPSYAIRHTLALTPDESIYGLGQYDRPCMDYRGREVLLVQTNIGIVVPFMVQRTLHIRLMATSTDGRAPRKTLRYRGDAVDVRFDG